MKMYLFTVVLLLGSLSAMPVYADMNGAQPETPASMKQPPVAGSPVTNRNGVPELTVEFQTAHADIPASYSRNLNEFGKYLVANPKSTAEIAGYADHTGHAPANTSLAQKRADAVKKYLVANWAVAPDRIKAEGYGEVSEKSRNITVADKQANRTAVATIVNPS